MSEEVICSKRLRDKEELTIRIAVPPLSKKINVLPTHELSKTDSETRARLFELS